MLRIPGQPGRDLCDTHLGITRRDHFARFDLTHALQAFLSHAQSALLARVVIAIGSTITRARAFGLACIGYSRRTAGARTPGAR